MVQPEALPSISGSFPSTALFPSYRPQKADTFHTDNASLKGGSRPVQVILRSP